MNKSSSAMAMDRRCFNTWLAAGLAAGLFPGLVRGRVTSEQKLKVSALQMTPRLTVTRPYLATGEINEYVPEYLL